MYRQYIQTNWRIYGNLPSEFVSDNNISFFKERMFFYISLKNFGTPGFRDSEIPWFRDFSFFLSSTFVYELILLKISMNANIVKTHPFYKIKYDLKGHSRSQTTTILFKNSLFLLFVLLIDWRNKCRWTLWKKKIIQRQHLPCFYLNLRSYGQLFVLVLWSSIPHKV